MTVAVTVTWSLGPGVDGEMLGVLMFGPGGGAATIAMDGSSNRSERTKVKFLTTGDMVFSLVITGEAGTYLSCNQEEQIWKILSGCKVSLRL